MTITRLDRRSILISTSALAAVAAVSRHTGALALAYADTGEEFVQPIAPDHVKKLAENLAASDFVKPVVELPAPFNKLTYDQYRDIRFRTDHAIWHGEKLDYELQLFPLGWLYDAPVEVWIVDGDKARQLKADSRYFTVGPLIGPAPEEAPFGFSGFRIHGPINRADYYDEYVVFQGATYLRAVARGQVYGMSARGLAIDTARPGGEEFPFFRSFWIEKPKAGAPEIVVQALLDSVSTTGAYRFTIQPGQTTLMDVDLTLFPRRQMAHVGVAPLTSMFLHGPAHQRVNGDFRPSVHDSEGLAILNGRGERLWRQLTNPMKLQTSAFVDKDPKGFGLSQRDRRFSNFEDLEARYERRPTVWVEPKGSWGDGYVELVEIPADEEIHDNIFAAWKPAQALEAGRAYEFAYRLHWTADVPVAWTGAMVSKTRVGRGRKPGTFLFVIDFEGPALNEAAELPVAELTVNPGEVSNVVVQRHRETGGVRVSFELNPDGTEISELRLALKAKEQLISESWLYRWTKS